jgi:coproporphyrinogen III oxidase
MDPHAIKAYLDGLQQRITGEIAARANAPFEIDDWQRAEGGGGRVMVMEDSPLMDRAGVNVSHVFGKALPPSATANRPELTGRAFEAMGLSLVMHPVNPFAPTVHMNIRFLRAFFAEKSEIPAAQNSPISSQNSGKPDDVWWFGGGMDLTPSYGFEEDAVHFHSQCKAALDPFDVGYYPRYKKWCDDYFFIKHRNEPRGIGGIFYDDFHEGGFARGFAMMQSVGDHFVKAYLPILDRRRDLPFTDDQKAWQTMRRGRYVEFNLVYDRGTLFGLQSKGHIDGILMSLPTKVGWRYKPAIAPGSPEAGLREFLGPHNWLKLPETAPQV